MPLSKARNAERMRLARLHVQPNVKTPVKPDSGGAAVAVQSHKLDSAGSTPAPATKEARLELARSIIAGVVQPNVQPEEYIPIYNPAIHNKAGIRVRIPGQPGVHITQELDGDGHPVW